MKSDYEQLLCDLKTYKYDLIRDFLRRLDKICVVLNLSGIEELKENCNAWFPGVMELVLRASFKSIEFTRELRYVDEFGYDFIYGKTPFEMKMTATGAGAGWNNTCSYGKEVKKVDYHLLWRIDFNEVENPKFYISLADLDECCGYIHDGRGTHNSQLRFFIDEHNYINVVHGALVLPEKNRIYIHHIPESIDGTKERW